MGLNVSAIIPALEAASSLAATVQSIAGVDEMIVVDGGSTDDTQAVARRCGARVIEAPRGRGGQLAAGAAQARGVWLLFLHADTVLDPAWTDDVARFTTDPRSAAMAAVFRFALDGPSAQARRLERTVNWRARILGLPYGDQGLLIGRAFYEQLGGYRPLPLMEDVDLVRRIGRKRIVHFDTAARTSSIRWRQDGWWRRSIRNVACLSLYFAGVSPRAIHKLYR